MGYIENSLRRFGAMTFLSGVLLCCGFTERVEAFGCFGKSESAACSGLGACVMADICRCEPGWSGPECETANFCGEPSCPLSCGSHGTCTQSGASGSCSCSPGFTGKCCNTPVLTRTAEPVDFGSIKIGGHSRMEIVTVENPYMSGMTIGAIELQGAGRDDFTLLKGCASGDTVEAGKSCDIAVRFIPQSPGQRKAKLSVSAVNESTVIALTTPLNGIGAIPSSRVLRDSMGSKTRYAWLDGAGIFKSTDGGSTWAPAETQPGNRNVRAVVIKPDQSWRLYAATFGGGVYVSINSGLDWIACATQPANLNLVSLEFDAYGRLFAGSEGDAFVSDGGCGVWDVANSGLLSRRMGAETVRF